jgi:hypothetical protein
MKKMKTITAPIVAIIASCLSPAPAQAQCDGQFATGTICGNSTGATASPRGNLPSAFGLITISSLTNSLGIDTAMPSAGTYVDGPSVAQGTSGTWFATGTVTLDDETNASVYSCKLWDGTTVIASASKTLNSPQYYTSIALSGVLASPAANIRISCTDLFQTTGKMMATTKDGTTKASTVTVVRIN